MMWPGQRRLEERIAELEGRQYSSYTEAVIGLLASQAGDGAQAIATATGALEAAAGFVGRAFASAEVEAPDMAREALSPACLSMIGRALLTRGEIVFRIEVEGSRIILQPSESHNILGGPDPRGWSYRCNVAGPSQILTYHRVPSEGIVHIAYSRDAARPWVGHGPITVASLAGRLSAETAAALADESSGPRGAFLPTPAPGQDESVNAIKGDIRKARGDLLMVQAGDWAEAGTAEAQWNAKRFGADPPMGLVQLMERASAEVLMACGFNVALWSDQGAATAREAYRQALHSVIAPLGRLVSAELSAKLETEVRLDWTELRAGDISGRARAFQSLVGGGMDMQAAAAASGILISEGAP